jgi:transposase
MARTKQFSAEVRERAVRLVGERESGYASQWAAIQSISEKIDCSDGDPSGLDPAGAMMAGAPPWPPKSGSGSRSWSEKSATVRRAIEILRTRPRGRGYRIHRAAPLRAG